MTLLEALTRGKQRGREQEAKEGSGKSKNEDQPTRNDLRGRVWSSRTSSFSATRERRDPCNNGRGTLFISYQTIKIETLTQREVPYPTMCPAPSRVALCHLEVTTSRLTLSVGICANHLKVAVVRPCGIT